jgi:uncharacterized membrane-anchored protein YitT (DUF2179 family)
MIALYRTCCTLLSGIVLVFTLNNKIMVCWNSFSGEVINIVGEKHVGLKKIIFIEKLEKLMSYHT